MSDLPEVVAHMNHIEHDGHAVDARFRCADQYLEHLREARAVDRERTREVRDDADLDQLRRFFRCDFSAR